MKFARSSVLLPVLFLLAACSLFSQSQPDSARPHGAPHDAQTDAAFDHFYNMEYERAIQDFEKMVQKRPNDAFAVNHLLTAILMSNLYETGGMNTGDYTNESFIGHAPRPTDPKVKERIKSLVRGPRILRRSSSKPIPKTSMRSTVAASRAPSLPFTPGWWNAPGSPRCATPSVRATT